MKSGDKIKELRTANELTQTMLAEKTGISRSIISQYENNQVEPTATVIAKLATALGCSADYLLGLEDDFGTKTVYPARETERISTDEAKLLQYFRKNSDEGKKLILKMAEMLSKLS